MGQVVKYRSEPFSFFSMLLEGTGGNLWREQGPVQVAFAVGR